MINVTRKNGTSVSEGLALFNCNINRNGMIFVIPTFNYILFIAHLFNLI